MAWDPRRHSFTAAERSCAASTTISARGVREGMARRGVEVDLRGDSRPPSRRPPATLKATLTTGTRHRGRPDHAGDGQASQHRGAGSRRRRRRPGGRRRRHGRPVLAIEPRQYVRGGRRHQPAQPHAGGDPRGPCLCRHRVRRQADCRRPCQCADRRVLSARDRHGGAERGAGARPVRQGRRSTRPASGPCATRLPAARSVP